MINTVGYVVKDDGETLLLTSSVAGNGSVLDTLCIPAGAIQEVEEME